MNLNSELNFSNLDEQFGVQISPEQETTRNSHIEECKVLGYEPTKPELDMYFSRDRFAFVFQGRATHAFLQKCIDVESLEIAEDQAVAVEAQLDRLATPEDVIGNIPNELTTNLYTSLWWRLQDLEDTQKSDSAKNSGYTIQDAKEIRDALLQGNSKLPLEKTIPYMARALNDEGSLKNKILKLIGRRQIKKVGSSLSPFGFGFGVVARKALEKRYGDCVIATIQSGKDERAKKTAVKAIKNLNDFYGLSRYTNETDIRQALENTLNIVEPINNPILVFTNRLLNPRKMI